jgi:hypothetical protein
MRDANHIIAFAVFHPHAATVVNAAIRERVPSQEVLHHIMFCPADIVPVRGHGVRFTA